MKPPTWVLRETVLDLHEQLLAAFGGASGVREEGLLKHPFVDGNKRTGFVVAALFLELNGYRLVANETEAAIHGLAAGETREADYASWMQAKSRPV